MIETTEPLANGSLLPTHPASTTSRHVVQYLKVHDAADGTELQGGKLGGTELNMLMSGNQMALSHLYLFACRNHHIYHTRPSVIINVITTDADPE